MPYCKNCGSEYNENQDVCLGCGVIIEKKVEEIDYNNIAKIIISIVLLIFFYPAGIIFMWASSTFSLKTRGVITMLFLLAIIIGIGSLILWTSSPGYMY